MTLMSIRPDARLDPHLRAWPRAGSFPDGSVATMGVFDGFHRGHQALVARARARARQWGVPSVLVTFDPHPLLLTCPERAPRPLLSVAQRVERALELGIDHVLVLPFDRALAATSAQDFVREGLVGCLNIRDVVVGENFRFGRGGAGTVDFLTASGGWYGFGVHGLPLVTHQGQICSSTAVRGLVAAGDSEGAALLLGSSAERVLGERELNR